MPDTKLILTDLDEVVLQWGSSFETWCRANSERLGLTIPNTRMREFENIELWLECSLDTTRELVKEFNSCKLNFPRIPPYEDALEYIPKLKKEGYSFVAITACAADEWTHDARRENLNMYFNGVFDTIHCVGLAASKTEYLHRYKPTWWVEDKFAHAEDGGRLGHYAFLITRPYNRNLQVQDSKRVSGWKEIYNCINTDDCFEYGWMA